MGFVWNTFCAVGGSSEFPTGDTDALRRSRSETLLTKCVQAIIACNVGWQLDTTKSATDTSYTDIPCRNNSSKTYPGLFLKNSTSGCKMFIAYFGDEIQNCGIKNFGGSDLVKYDAGYYYHGGVCISIIPSESQSTFGDPTTTTFIPSDATRICGTCYRITFNSSVMYSAAYNPASGGYYNYFVGVTPCTIAIFTAPFSGPPGHSTYNPIYATGKLLGALAHEEDNSVNSQYATLLFKNICGDREGWAANLASNPTIYATAALNIYIPGACYACGNTYYNSFTNGCITKSDGSWINNSNKSNKNVLFYPGGAVESLLSCSFDTTSNKTRWIPLAISSFSNDLSTDGVVSGDGFKGYLDTDLFRMGIASRGQTFDNGKFMCAEDNTNLLISQDSWI